MDQPQLPKTRPTLFTRMFGATCSNREVCLAGMVITALSTTALTWTLESDGTAAGTAVGFGTAAIIAAISPTQ